MAKRVVAVVIVVVSADVVQTVSGFLDPINHSNFCLCLTTKPKLSETTTGLKRQLRLKFLKVWAFFRLNWPRYLFLPNELSSVRLPNDGRGNDLY